MSKPKVLEIASPEALDAHVAEVVRLRVRLTAAMANKDAEVVKIEKQHQASILKLQEQIAAAEEAVREYSAANRGSVFGDKRKSRETPLAEFGFELTPPRVETANKKIKWKDVVARLGRLAWGKAYLNLPAPKPDKEALLADREKLSPEQLTAAGIQFCQDEQFFIRPKPETAADSAVAA
jgi:phage host-nuclease inhibitor protein Gam